MEKENVGLMFLNRCIIGGVNHSNDAEHVGLGWWTVGQDINNTEQMPAGVDMSTVKVLYRVSTKRSNLNTQGLTLKDKNHIFVKRTSEICLSLFFWFMLIPIAWNNKMHLLKLYLRLLKNIIIGEQGTCWEVLLAIYLNVCILGFWGN